MTKAIAHNVQNILRYRERMVIVLIALVVILSSSYVFFVQKAIVNVVNRQKIMAEIQTDTTNVSTLENQYFTLENSITPDLAHSMGFKDATVASYISVPARQAHQTVANVDGASQVLTFNNE